jgi:hypothetical protein
MVVILGDYIKNIRIYLIMFSSGHLFSYAEIYTKETHPTLKSTVSGIAETCSWKEAHVSKEYFISIFRIEEKAG